MEAPVAKDLQIFSPTHPALLEDCVPVRSSRWWQVLIKRGRWRTTTPVDGQWRGRFLSWKGVWWIVAPLCFGFKPMQLIPLNPVFPRLIFLTFLKSSWLSTWQGEEHGSGRQAQLLAGEAGHPWSQWQRSSPGLRDVERFKTRLWRRVNYLAVEVQDIARRCIAAEPPILIENNYE